MERKVIFHVDECGRFELAAGNIHNMCRFYREREIPVVIELLLNGEAVRAAVAVAAEAEGCRELLREEGVEIAVCNNALRKNGIAAEELTEGVRVVPAGVVELAERQFQGYAYIRP
ncbi:DsrE family protein [Eisenbergiella sp.]